MRRRASGSLLSGRPAQLVGARRGVRRVGMGVNSGADIALITLSAEFRGPEPTPPYSEARRTALCDDSKLRAQRL